MSTDESEGPWVSTNRHTGAKRKIHYSRDCQYLQNADSVKEASEGQIGWLEDCSSVACSGEPNRSGGTGDGHLESLKQAAQDDP